MRNPSASKRVAAWAWPEATGAQRYSAGPSRDFHETTQTPAAVNQRNQTARDVGESAGRPTLTPGLSPS